MVSSFPAKRLGRRSGADTAVEEARVELARLAAVQPSLRGPALWLRELLADLASPCDGAIPTLSSEVAQAKLTSGIPLLRGEQLPIDVKAFRRSWQRACEVLQSVQGSDEIARLAQAVCSGSLDPHEIVQTILAGRPEAIHERAAALSLDPALTATLVRFSLFPDFVALNAAWSSHHRSVWWQRGYCPTCGSWPLLGEFRGLEQLRYLRCGLCAAAWKVPRLFCPYCGNRDHEQLVFFHREGDENRLLAATCKLCHRYVKMINTLGELPPLRLWVADVSSLHLDLVRT